MIKVCQAATVVMFNLVIMTFQQKIIIVNFAHWYFMRGFDLLQRVRFLWYTYASCDTIPHLYVKNALYPFILYKYILLTEVNVVNTISNTCKNSGKTFCDCSGRGGYLYTNTTQFVDCSTSYSFKFQIVENFSFEY